MKNLKMNFMDFLDFSLRSSVHFTCV